MFLVQLLLYLGTGISFQLQVRTGNTTTWNSPPHNYAFIPAAALATVGVSVQKQVSGNSDGSGSHLQYTCSSTADTSLPSLANHLNNRAKVKENNWIDHALALTKRAELDKEDFIAWATYHASQQAPAKKPSCSMYIPAFVL